MSKSVEAQEVDGDMLVAEIFVNRKGETRFKFQRIMPLDMAAICLNFLSSFVGNLSQAQPKQTKSGITLVS